MTITAHCHWGIAEDVCIVTDNFPAILMEEVYGNKWVHGSCDSLQIPMTKDQARALAAQLLIAADLCDKYEQNIPREPE